MKIRRAESAELPRISELYAAAREYMRRAGNAEQWRGGYPSDEMISEDIQKHRLYVCEDGGDILGVFCYFIGEEPTYRVIEDGTWECDDTARPQYGVMHRVAVDDGAHGRGVARQFFEYALEKCPELRIDTHRDNIPMQRALAKYGFQRRGIIYLENGDERIAFQKIRRQSHE